MKRTNDLGNDSIPRLVLRLAIPAMVAQLVNVLYGIVDRMYIGNIPDIGETALAGAGICGPIVTLLSSFGTLVGLGGAPLLTIRMGEKNLKGARQILANCFLLLLVLAGVLTGLFLLIKRPLLLWFGASAATLRNDATSLTIYTAGTFFALLAAGLNYFIICQGYSTTGMATVLLGAVLNILLDPLFIFTLRMGVAGAALATVLSQVASCAFVLLFLFHRNTPVRITFGGYSARIIRRVLAFGLSPFIILATDSLLLIVLNAVLQRYGGPGEGDRLITGATIVQSYMMIITMPMAGITGGTQPILSYNYGARQTARIRQGIRWILLLCLVFTGGMFAVSQLAPRVFVRIFTADPALIDLSSWGIQTFTLAIIPLGFQYTFVDAMTALGITRVSVSLSLFRKISYMAGTLAFAALWGARAAFYAEPAADLLGAAVSTLVFSRLFGRLMRRRDAMPEGQALYT